MANSYGTFNVTKSCVNTSGPQLKKEKRGIVKLIAKIIGGLSTTIFEYLSPSDAL